MSWVKVNGTGWRQMELGGGGCTVQYYPVLNRAKDYYENDKERLREQARDKYRNLSEEKKNEKREHGKNRYHNMSEERKHRLKEYQKNYRETKKSQSIN